jgi:hypothetical protein
MGMNLLRGEMLAEEGFHLLKNVRMVAVLGEDVIAFWDEVGLHHAAANVLGEVDHVFWQRQFITRSINQHARGA